MACASAMRAYEFHRLFHKYVENSDRAKLLGPCRALELRLEWVCEDSHYWWFLDLACFGLRAATPKNLLPTIRRRRPSWTRCSSLAASRPGRKCSTWAV